MNKEELIGKLQMVYVGDINALNELIGYYDGLKQGIEELQQENKKLNGAIQTYDILLKSNVEENKKLKEALANNGIVSTCENCETFGICPHSYREYDYKYECDKLKQEMNKVAIQQKKFIKYLEDDLKENYRDMGYRHNIFREILDKYEEIIGDIDDKRYR